MFVSVKSFMRRMANEACVLPPGVRLIRHEAFKNISARDITRGSLEPDV